MSRLTFFAKKIRHAPGLRRFEQLWQALRPVYHRIIDPAGRGLSVSLGGRLVRFPPELFSTNPDWSNYERESFAALARWLDAHSACPTLLDVGCSFGVVTSFAVQLCPQLEIIAFDSDLVSLRALEAVVPANAHQRVRRIEGLLGVEHRSGQSLDDAIASTQRRLPAIAPRSAIMRSAFLCFGETGAEAAPHHQLDVLLATTDFPGPVLLKCDVEGSELLVLRGASAFLRRVHPILLLSVHPPTLPRFGHTVADVAAFLQDHHYTWQVIARDHEEHWWCEPSPE